MLPALADKQWGGNLQDQDYDALFAALQPAAPGQNLDRTIPTKSSTILRYKFTPSPKPDAAKPSNTVKDLSSNGYDANTDCSIADGAMQFRDGCSVTTPLTSKGRNYTLFFTLKQTAATPGPLFSSEDAILASGNGSSGAVMMISGGNAFPLNYSLPVGRWMDASLIARGNRTFFAVDSGKEMEFTAKIGVNGEFNVLREMSIVAPLTTIGGGAWKGEMKGVELLDHS